MNFNNILFLSFNEFSYSTKICKIPTKKLKKVGLKMCD